MPPVPHQIARLVEAGRAAEGATALTHGLLDTPGPVLRKGLAALRGAGALGDTILAVEHRLAGVSRADFRAATERLRGIELGLAASIDVRRTDSDRAQARRDHFDRLLRDVRGDQRPLRWAPSPLTIDHLLYSLALVDDFIRKLPDGGGFSPSWPMLLTDFLLQRRGPLLSDGSCLPSTALAGHLASLIGLPYQLLKHTNHVNLYHAGRRVVVDPNLRHNIVSLPSHWRAIGKLGEGQGPQPLEALVTGLLTNLAVQTKPTDRGLARRLEEAALRIYPGDPVGHLILAGLVETPGRQRALLERAIARNRRYTMPHLGLGDLELEVGRPREAIRSYRRALALSRRNRRRAIRIWGRGTGLGPSREDLSYVTENLATALNAAGDQKGGLRHWHEAIRLDPRNLSARYELAVQGLARGRLADAERHVVRLLSATSDPEIQAGALLLLGQVAWLRGLPAIALERWQSAIALRPDVVQMVITYIGKQPAPSP